MNILDTSGDDLPWKKTFRMYDENIQKNLKSACQHLIKPNVTIESYFFISSSFEAKAKKRDDCYSIGLSAAVIPKLLYLLRATIEGGAHFMATEASVTTDPFLTRECGELLLDETLYQSLSDENEQLLLESCMVIALDIIVSHELVHILNGHLGWLEQSGVANVDQAHLAINEDVRNQRQVLEYDADCTGIHRSFLRSFGVVLDDVNGLNSEQKISPPPYGPHGVMYQTLFAYSLATAATVSFLSLEDMSVESSSAHPSGWFRRDLTYQIATSVPWKRFISVGSSDAESLAYYFSPMMKGFSNVDRVWKNISGIDTGFEAFKNNPLDLNRLHLLDKYLNGWNELYPKLHNHKLVASAWDAF